MQKERPGHSVHPYFRGCRWALHPCRWTQLHGVQFRERDRFTHDMKGFERCSLNDERGIL